MTHNRAHITCACGCGRTGQNRGRGLVSGCYAREDRAGRIHQWPPRFPPPTPRRVDRPDALGRIEDYVELREWGLTQREAADRMGVAYRSTTRWHSHLRAIGADHPWLYDLPFHPCTSRPAQEEKALAA